VKLTPYTGGEATLRYYQDAAIRAVLEKIARCGTEGLENPQIFQTPEVKAARGLAALMAAGKPAELLRETKVRMVTV
jgi:type I restriction enzyme, R subunit